MNQLVCLGKNLAFHMRWAVMSHEQKYAFLWARTKKSHSYAEASLQARKKEDLIQ
jgi:hypothetical protein